jgi:hypothetical protein
VNYDECLYMVIHNGRSGAGITKSVSIMICAHFRVILQSVWNLKSVM